MSIISIPGASLIAVHWAANADESVLAAPIWRLSVPQDHCLASLTGRTGQHLQQGPASLLLYVIAALIKQQRKHLIDDCRDQAGSGSNPIMPALSYQ